MRWLAIGEGGEDLVGAGEVELGEVVVEEGRPIC